MMNEIVNLAASLFAGVVLGDAAYPSNETIKRIGTGYPS